MSRNYTEAQYQEDVRNFREQIMLERMERIESITATENAYLYPYYLNYKELTSGYKIGVFILDARGIYTPIETGECGVLHVERLPIVKPAVYGITDLSNCAVLFEGNEIIIFQGVVKLREYGWRFVDESFQIKPITGFTPKDSKRLVLTDKLVGAEASAAPHDVYDDDFPDYVED